MKHALQCIGLYCLIGLLSPMAHSEDDFVVMSYACNNDNGYGFAMHINSYNQMKVGETMLSPVENDTSSYEFNYTDGIGDTYNHLLVAAPTFAQIPPRESFFVEYKMRVKTASDGKIKSKTIEAFCNPIK